MLRWRSLWSCAKNLYSNPANAVDFIAHPQPLVAEADRVYRDPDSGTWWWFAQQDLPEGASVVALIVYSDETNLSKDGSVTGWPVYVSLANISSGNRWKPHGRRLVALLPKVTEDMLAPGSCIVRRRMEIFQQALDMIMGDCMAAADKGEPVLDPYGIRRMAYPLLYAYVGDYPEQCKVAGTKSGHSTNFPCPRCMVHRKQLAKTEMRAQRTVAAQKHTWMEMGCLRQPTDLLRLETANSQHHVHALESGTPTVTGRNGQINMDKPTGNHWQQLCATAPGDMDRLQPTIRGSLLAGETCDATIHLHTGVGIPGRENYDLYSRHAQYARATPSFYGKPWYSDVSRKEAVAGRVHRALLKIMTWRGWFGAQG
ncbi:hypothetical protein CLOP_g16649 [Closterium sp. NIES-67]|nr:hypothetical protein CLOP_g21277 [Closterium sp. NIES-67]GJP86653.1 hypothetical protein CLOP_g16649 [Closterium sp. NIES-67]